MDISLLRALSSILFIIFIPGLLILRLLEIHEIGIGKTILYSIGISISFVMFLGFLMNSIYPILGIDNPISLNNILIILLLILGLMTFMVYLRDGYTQNKYILVNDYTSPQFFFLLLLPFLSILGAFFVNNFQNNFLLIILILIISLIPIFIMATNKFNSNLYPIAIFILSLSLLLHRSLISNYIWGQDVHLEYYFSNQVILHSYWNWAITYSYNTMLSVTMLAPIVSILSDINLNIVFKFIYSLILSLVPTGLYYVFKDQFNKKTAFLACFFFISLFSFYGELLTLMRQIIAELFFVLLLMIFLEKRISRIQQSILIIIFGLSIIVSHYGISYIFMFILLFTLIMFLIVKFLQNRNFLTLQIDTKVSITFVLLFFVFGISWYMYLSSASSLDAFVGSITNIFSSITELFNPDTVQALGIISTSKGTLLHQMGKYIHLITQAFILIGFLHVMRQVVRERVEKSMIYLIFSLGSILILLLCLTLPFFSNTLNTSRFYQISLLLLAPFMIIGFLCALNYFFRAFKINLEKKYLYILISIFLTVYLLFNSGFVYEILNDNPTSISLSQNKIINGDTNQKVDLFMTLNVFDQDYYAMSWFDKKVDRTQEIKIYADYIGWHAVTSYGNTFKYRLSLSNQTSYLRNNSYVFLGYVDLNENVIVGFEKYKYPTYNLTSFSKVFNQTDKIYDNGASQLLFNKFE